VVAKKERVVQDQVGWGGSGGEKLKGKRRWFDHGTIMGGHPSFSTGKKSSRTPNRKKRRGKKVHQRLKKSWGGKPQ